MLARRALEALAHLPADERLRELSPKFMARVDTERTNRREA